MSRRINKIHDVLTDLLLHVDDIRQLAQTLHVIRRQHRLHLRLRRDGRHAVQNLQFIRLVRIIHLQFEHETIDLRLRQRIRAFLFDRILRRQNHERIVQFERAVADGHLPFLHRFQQRALDFRGSAVDFIRKHDIRENRAFLRREIACFRIVDHCSDDVRRQQIRRELNSMETRLQALREARHRQRLRQTGHTFNQHMVVAKQRQQQTADQFVLPDDHAADFHLHAFQRRRFFFHLFGYLSNIRTHFLFPYSYYY